MKIKQVCEQTGLTDRAIRFYIEEGLAAPKYTENYLGRRSYDFSEEDVAALNSVATLRKFGFAVEEIRAIIADPQESVAIVAAVRARKEETVRQESGNLAALARLESDKAYTMAELAEALVEPAKTAEIPKEDRWMNWKERLIAWLKATPEWVVMLLPVLLVLLCVVSAEIDMRYLQYGDFLRVLPVVGMLVLLPTIAIAVVKLVNHFRSRPVRTVTRVGVVILCLLYMPVSIIFACFGFGFSLYESTTDDPAHYLKTDRNFHMSELAWELFPDEPHTMTYTWQDGGYQQQATDVTYYYYHNYDGYYEVYTQWRLSPEELSAEIARAEALMSGENTYIRGNHGDFEYMAVRGQWYSGGSNVPMSCTPFVLDKRSQDLTMFAWNAETCEVRYISCERYGSLADPPHYMTLDW